MTALLDAIRSKTDSALASGDLSPLETSETVVEQNGLRFIVRWAEALARKDAAKAAAPAAAPAPAAGADAVILPGGPRPGQYGTVDPVEVPRFNERDDARHGATLGELTDISFGARHIVIDKDDLRRQPQRARGGKLSLRHPKTAVL